MKHGWYLSQKFCVCLSILSTTRKAVNCPSSFGLNIKDLIKAWDQIKGDTRNCHSRDQVEKLSWSRTNRVSRMRSYTSGGWQDCDKNSKMAEFIWFEHQRFQKRYGIRVKVIPGIVILDIMFENISATLPSASTNTDLFSVNR